MKRSFYSDSISSFLQTPTEQILGALAQSNDFSLELTQKDAWLQEIRILKEILQDHNGLIFFEYSIPRMGKRADVILILDGLIFVLEFKTNEILFKRSDLDQCLDYALDLKYFHQESQKFKIKSYFQA